MGEYLALVCQQKIRLVRTLAGSQMLQEVVGRAENVLSVELREGVVAVSLVDMVLGRSHGVGEAHPGTQVSHLA